MTIMGHNANNAQRSTIPPGFIVVASGGDDLLIRHKRAALAGMNIFLMVWLAVWSCVCVKLLEQYIHGETMPDGGPTPLWVVEALWSGEAFAACLLVYCLFCRKSFRTDSECLRVETIVLGIRRSRIIPKETIRRFVQVKDGGNGEDGFPSWGLKVEAGRETTLLFHQPYEQSQWLGRILAEWAQVEFIGAIGE